MAELCLDCWNKLNETEDSPKWYILSREFDFCEECREFKPVIIAERLWSRVLRQLCEACSKPGRGCGIRI